MFVKARRSPGCRSASRLRPQSCHGLRDTSDEVLTAYLRVIALSRYAARVYCGGVSGVRISIAGNPADCAVSTAGRLAQAWPCVPAVAMHRRRSASESASPGLRRRGSLRRFLSAVMRVPRFPGPADCRQLSIRRLDTLRRCRCL